MWFHGVVSEVKTALTIDRTLMGHHFTGLVANVEFCDCIC